MKRVLFLICICFFMYGCSNDIETLSFCIKKQKGAYSKIETTSIWSSSIVLSYGGEISGKHSFSWYSGTKNGIIYLSEKDIFIVANKYVFMSTIKDNVFIFERTTNKQSSTSKQ